MIERSAGESLHDRGVGNAAFEEVVRHVEHRHCALIEWRNCSTENIILELQPSQVRQGDELRGNRSREPVSGEGHSAKMNEALQTRKIAMKGVVAEIKAGELQHVLKSRGWKGARQLNPVESEADDVGVEACDAQPPAAVVVARRAGPVGVEAHGGAQRVAKLDQIVTLVVVQLLLLEAATGCRHGRLQQQSYQQQHQIHVA